MSEVTAIQQPVIDDQLLPGESTTTEGSGSSNPSTRMDDTESLYAPEIPARSFPTQTIANDVISDSFDSQQKRILGAYEFGINGSIAVGTYEEGVSGDVRISPSGIVARNIDGDTTFTLDGATGDATFRGTIAANSLIAGRTDIGSAGGNVYIDGDNARIIISDGTNDRILIGKQTGGF